MQQGAHGVEAVGNMRDAEPDGLLRLLVGGIGMAHTDGDAGLNQPGYHPRRARQFRSNHQQAQVAVRQGKQPLRLLLVRHSKPGGRMSSPPGGTDIRPFQMNAKRLGSRCPASLPLDGQNSSLKLSIRHHPRHAHYGYKKRGDACGGSPMCVGVNLCSVCRMQVKASTAVCMHVDEAWHHDHAGRIDNATPVILVAGCNPCISNSLDAPTIDNDLAASNIRCCIDEMSIAYRKPH